MPDYHQYPSSMPPPEGDPRRLDPPPTGPSALKIVLVVLGVIALLFVLMVGCTILVANEIGDPDPVNTSTSVTTSSSPTVTTSEPASPSPSETSESSPDDSGTSSTRTAD